MNKTINVTLYDIINKIHLESAYIGAKAMGTDSSAFERISTIDADGDIIEKYVLDTLPILDSYLNRYKCSSKSNNDGVSFVISLSLPSNFGGSDDGIKNAIVDYIEKQVFANWVELSKAGNYEYYSSRAAEALTSLIRYLSRRNKPTRTEPTQIKYEKTKYTYEGNIRN